MKTKKSYYKIQIIPDSSGALKSFSIPKWFLKILLLGGVFIFCVGILVVVYSTDIAIQLRELDALKNQTKYLINENNDLQQSIKRLDKMQTKHQRLKELAQILKITKMTDSFQKNKQTQLKLLENKDIEEYVKSIQTNYLDQKENKGKIPNIQPVIGILTNTFSLDQKHPGVDIAAILNDPIYSTAPGIVTFSGWKDDLGKTITIDHSDNYQTVYAHLNKILINKGDFVERGRNIGMIGMTGNTTGPHLHYEVIHNNENLNPENYFGKKSEEEIKEIKNVKNK